ncbi:cytochrome P450 [Crepidotus variabilis]|uniref:Cytochrome P450 n=1 Tax=Crepidotus variabilis TaxID=179855 RepID=A0A9P6E6G9_9AGAR|nr:cytochrome P450 [Crepidotus variabilis]
MDTANIPLGAILGFVVYCILKFLYPLAFQKKNSDRLPYPPGPKPSFLIGNALDFPRSGHSKVFLQWGKISNSDVVFATAFGRHLIVLNSIKAADDLLGRKGDLYNDRPTLPVTGIIGWDWNMGLMEIGRGWRAHRRAAHEWLGKTAVHRYQSIQYQTVYNFLQKIVIDPDSYSQHSNTFSAEVILSMMYGYVPKSVQDPLVDAAEESALLAFGLILIGSSAIHLLPFLRHIPVWFPFASAQKKAARCRKITQEMQRLPVEFVKKSMADGSAVPSVLTDFYERQATTGVSEEEEEIMKNISWTAYGAASDTTATPIVVFIYLMVKYPEIQRRAQAEIDRVVGDERLPNFNDREDMPYIEAIYREVLRFHPPAVLSIPHTLTADDVYNGYFLPKGSTVYTNLWAMMHDERVFPEPDVFKPERFLDERGELLDSRVFAYGFGTHICPGRFIDSSNLWLLMASFLCCFNTSRAIDEAGNEVEINEEWLDFGAVIHKKPVACRITPRSIHKSSLIDAHVEQNN